MSTRAAEDIARHYVALYTNKFPSRRCKRPAPVLVRTLVSIAGRPALARHLLDVWFASADPRHEAEGYSFDRCFSAITRLVATGEVEPRGTPMQQQAIQAFARVVGPNLRLVRGLRPLR